MSGRGGAGGAGRAGWTSHGGRGGGGNNYNRRVNKPKGHKGLPELGENVFECGKPEHAALYERSKKEIANWLRRKASDKNEFVLVANAIDEMNPEVAIIPPQEPALVPDPTFVEDPNDPNATAPMVRDTLEFTLWSGEVKLIPGRRLALKTGLVSAYATIWEQCSVTMRAKLKQLPTYENMEQDKNPVTLLEEMRGIVCGRKRHQQPIYSMVLLIKAVALMIQKGDETNEKYKERFDGLWETVIEQGGSLTNHPGLIAETAEVVATEAGRPQPNATLTSGCPSYESNMCTLLVVFGSRENNVEAITMDPPPIHVPHSTMSPGIS